LLFVDTPVNEMKERIKHRNSYLSPETTGKGLDYLWIDEEAFEAFRNRFEPLEPDEEHIVLTSNLPTERQGVG
jgi:predicted kinase